MASNTVEIDDGILVLIAGKHSHEVVVRFRHVDVEPVRGEQLDPVADPVQLGGDALDAADRVLGPEGLHNFVVDVVLVVSLDNQPAVGIQSQIEAWRNSAERSSGARTLSISNMRTASTRSSGPRQFEARSSTIRQSTSGSRLRRPGAAGCSNTDLVRRPSDGERSTCTAERSSPPDRCTRVRRRCRTETDGRHRSCRGTRRMWHRTSDVKKSTTQ